MISFRDISAPSASSSRSVRTASVIVILSEANQLSAVDGAPFDVLGLDLAEVRPFLAEALSRAAPSKDAYGSFECLVPAEGGTLRRLVVAMLPTACSRNNSPAMPHAVAGIVRAHKGKGPLAIVLLSGPAHALPQALAVSRCFPTYSSTSGARKAAREGLPADPVDVFLHMAPAALGVSAPVLDCLASDIRLAQHLVDMPPADMNCSYYVDQCKATAAELASLGVSITVIRGEALRDMGCGGIWNVGMASEHPPALVVLSHTPKEAAAQAAKSVCLVGKGIVYDTGGLSIKVPPGMNGMKDDMAGSAACLGSFRSLVQAGGLASRPLHAVLCIAENSVDSRAFRPDDVLTMLSGKSVEINNTDAEGRLVLADGVAYAANTLNAGLIVDIATLTGAQLITTGKKHAAVYCSSAEVEAAAVAAGRRTGDLTFPMLYAPEFHRLEFKSAVADMRNSVADRMNAQSSCAAAFIGSHIDEYLEGGGDWCHVDMAGPAMVGDRASGFGVGLLFELARSWRG